MFPNIKWEPRKRGLWNFLSTSQPLTIFEIPSLEFKYLELNQQLYTLTIRDIPQTSLLDIPASNLLEQGLNPSYNGKSALNFLPIKAFWRIRIFLPSLNAPVYDVAPGGIQYPNDGLVQIA